MEAKNKRSVVFLGHAQAGKTSLAEAILFRCKATTRKGTIAEGNTVSDYNWDEIERKSSINSSFIFCDYQDIRLQMIDAPGFADFFGEVIASVRAVDNAVVVIDASQGVEVGTEKVWALLEEIGMPRLIFVNKTDKEGFDKDKVISDIRSVLSRSAVVLDTTSLETLMEEVAESDDSLLEKYLSNGKLTIEEIKAGLHTAVANAKVFPIILGSAQTEAGIDDLLKVIKDDLAAPTERPNMPVDQGSVEPSESAPFSAFVFKSIFDPYVGQLSLARVFSGKLTGNTTFYNVTQKNTERFGHLYFLQGKEQRAIETASAGDIVAIPKLKSTWTNDTLADQAHPVVFKPMQFPEAMMSASVKPKTRQDEEKISQALAKLVAEDPTFHEMVDPETKEMIVSGMGDLHLHIMLARLKKRFNVDVDMGKPKVPYKESISKSAKVQGKFKRQSGGRGQYGDAWIEVKPLEHGKGFEFVDKIVGGAIPRNFIPSVEKGVRAAMVQGVIAGYPVVDVQAILYDGSYHDVDSSDMAFQRAGGMALRKAVLAAGPVLLEPIMEIEVYIPEEYMGTVSGDLNSRRGRTLGMEVKGRVQALKASVPLSEMFTYASDLRSMTQGKASYTMKFSHYETVPNKIAAPIIQAYQEHHKEEEE
ncbi:MAG: elongation factor G [Candidatus Omnitrophica bacterium]|jgi:elongation factor G|nr:elongation factor G [Candidatus Omnitrophota bacterium]